MDKQELKRRLAIPVIGAPLFIISNPDLVLAQCKAGIVGAFPALNARPAEQLEAWLERITGELGVRSTSKAAQGARSRAEAFGWVVRD